MTDATPNPNATYIYSDPNTWNWIDRAIHTTGDIQSDDVLFLLGSEGHSMTSLVDAFQDGRIPMSAAQWGAIVAEQLRSGELQPHEIVGFLGVDHAIRDTVLQAMRDSGTECFLASTPIALPDGSARPIEQIHVGDEVLSYNATGALVAARVTRTLQKQVKHILDFHGTMVTPGHVYFCSEGKFAGQHVPLIDILRSDGGIQTQEGVNLRASTKAEIGSPLDQMIAVIAGERTGDGRAQVAEEGHIRLGTRYILEDGHDISIAELIAGAGGRVTEDGLIAQDGAEPAPFH